MSKKMSTSDFIKKAKEIHGDNYDYSKTRYVDAKTEICIICKKHGEFLQVASRHLAGNGCPICAIEKRKGSSHKKKTTKEFIYECISKYGNKYDYSKVNYVNSHTKVLIINKENGEEILVTPTTFLSKGCGDKRGWMSTEKFIEKAKKIHGNKYDYSETVYTHPKIKIKYKCPKHGEIEQLPDNHLKYGCGLCGNEEGYKKRLKKTDCFIEECIKTHGDKYDYSKVEYVNNHTKVCIICPEHGEFWQTPSKHISGQGCPKCKSSKLEEEMMLYLDKNKIKYETQYAPKFLKNGKGLQKLDFYLPEYNVAIECQGIQHFVPSRYSAFYSVDLNKKRDIVKAKKCKEQGIKILYYTTKDNINFINECEIYNNDNIFSNIGETLNKLREVL